MALDEGQLASYVARQLATFYPDREVTKTDLTSAVSLALERHGRCFGRVGLKGAAPTVEHLHTDQYAAFLYLLSNTLFHAGNVELASKTYALNKALHCVDLLYEVELPEVFALQHPVGTVIGRGKFDGYLFVYQRCTVGSNLTGAYPRIGEGVVMFGGSVIIGDSTVGANTWLSAGTLVLDQDVPGNCVVFGRSPDLVFRPTKRDVKRDMFKIEQ